MLKKILAYLFFIINSKFIIDIFHLCESLIFDL